MRVGYREAVCSSTVTRFGLSNVPCMMPSLDHIAPGQVAIAAFTIFVCRILDVSLGTMRTISLVHGRAVLAVVLGFFEVLVWISVVSQVISEVKTNPVLLLAYAGGFAAGNGIGIALERKIAMGTQVVRIISQHAGPVIAAKIREIGQAVTTFVGEGRDGPVTLIYVTCPRRRVEQILSTAMLLDPQLFYVTESATGWNRRVRAMAFNMHSVAKRR